VAVIRPGKILFEMEGVGLDIARQQWRPGGAQDRDETKFVWPAEMGE